MGDCLGSIKTRNPATCHSRPWGLCEFVAGPILRSRLFLLWRQRQLRILHGPFRLSLLPQNNLRCGDGHPIWIFRGWPTHCMGSRGLPEDRLPRCATRCGHVRSNGWVHFSSSSQDLHIHLRPCYGLRCSRNGCDHRIGNRPRYCHHLRRSDGKILRWALLS